MGIFGSKSASSNRDAPTAKEGAHSKVWFDVSIGSDVVGRIDMELHGDTPKTSENFFILCTN